jgi:hypothetical protein
VTETLAVIAIAAVLLGWVLLGGWLDVRRHRRHLERQRPTCFDEASQLWSNADERP